jgi:hypothetical protein
MRFALMEGVTGGSSGTTLYFDTGTVGPWPGWGAIALLQDIWWSQSALNQPVHDNVQPIGIEITRAIICLIISLVRTCVYGSCQSRMYKPFSGSRPPKLSVH